MKTRFKILEEEYRLLPEIWITLLAKWRARGKHMKEQSTILLENKHKSTMPSTERRLKYKNS